MGRFSRVTGAVVFLLISSTACSTASYEEKINYLRTIAKRGVDAHNLLTSQGAVIDAKRCAAAYEGLTNDIPRDDPANGLSPEWREQVKAFFVDSCVSGLPKPVPGQAPVSPSPASSAEVGSSPSPSGSRK